jgi:hypothetical protein
MNKSDLDDFNFTLTTAVLNTNNYSIAVSTSQSCLISNFVYSRLIFDQTAL